MKPEFLSSCTVYVDVDDTLLRSVGSKRIPIPGVIAQVRALSKRGVTLYCWSAGGADYAKQSAEEVGLADCFALYLPKPSVMIDDQAPADWPMARVVHPSNCSDDVVYAALKGDKS